MKTLCKRDPEAVRRILGLDGAVKAKSAPMLAPGAGREEKRAAEDQNVALADADRLIRRGLDSVKDFDAYVGGPRGKFDADMQRSYDVVGGRSAS